MVEPCRETALLPALVVSRQKRQMDQSARVALWQSRLARGSAFARRRKCRLPYNYGAGAVTGRAAKAERGDITRRTAAHTAVRTCVDGTTGARTTRSAAFGRRDDSLAARRSLGVAGVCSDRAEPAMRAGGAVMSLDTRRRKRHGARRTRVSTARSAHARQGRRRSFGTTTRSRLGARLASPVSALTEPTRRCDAESRRRGDVTRHTTAHTTRHGARVCRRHDRRTHDEVSGARSARRLARGSALAWRRRCRP